MATPAIRALARTFPHSDITALVRPEIGETLAGNPWITNTILHDHRSRNRYLGSWSVALRLRRERYDLGILFTNSLRSAWIALVGGVKRRVGYARDGRRILLNDPVAVRRGRHGYPPAPIIDSYLRLAYHAGAARESYQMELATNPLDEARANSLWDRLRIAPGERIIALHPGSAFGPAKRWPSTSFAELARRIVDERVGRVLVLCGPEERGLARSIADRSARPRAVHSLAEETLSVGLTKAIVRRVALLISTDSGPRHFAAPFGVPVVSLFGPTHMAWTHTYYDRETALQVPVECGPCQQRTCPLSHHRCMNELSVERVYGVVRGHIALRLSA